MDKMEDKTLILWDAPRLPVVFFLHIHKLKAFISVCVFGVLLYYFFKKSFEYSTYAGQRTSAAWV